MPFWLMRVQKLLMEAGFYCGEEEDEAFLFSTGTKSALLTFQACNALAETGVADEPTWRKLLGVDADAAFAAQSAGVSRGHYIWCGLGLVNVGRVCEFSVSVATLSCCHMQFAAIL
jgi:hypothetical protein